MSGARNPSPSNDNLTLKINGMAYSGWTSIRVTRSLEHFPSSFSIELTDKAPPAAVRAIVNEGDPCAVSLGSDLVITGYADTVEYAFDAEAHALRIAGRSKTEDLVDCSAEWDGCSIVNSTLLEITTKLAKPYGISVKGVGDPGRVIPVYVFGLGIGTFDLIETMARYVGKLIIDQPDGSIVIGDVGTKTMASGFVEGQNVLSAKTVFSTVNRFSEIKAYIVSMDTLADGNSDGASGGNLISTWPDPNIRRHRLKYFIAEAGDSDFATAKKRGAWMAARNAGRGRQVRIVCDSWRDKDGTLWAPNMLARVDLPTLKIRQQLLIAEVTFKLDAATGTTAELLLMPPASFTPEPIVITPPLQLPNQPALGIPRG